MVLDPPKIESKRKTLFAGMHETAAFRCGKVSLILVKTESEYTSTTY
jgi:hypothetical protein